MRRILLLMTTLLAVARFASAQDRAVIETGADNKTRALAGVIEDFSGKELRMKLATGQALVVPAARVKQVAPQLTAAHEKAAQLAQQHKFAEAIEAFREANFAENRPWMKRRILADVVTCFEALGQVDRAGDAFVLVMKSDEHWQYLERIPLNWSGGLVDAATEQRARAWLGMNDLAPAKLLGASYALAGSHRAEAVETLRTLSTFDDSRIAHLADAQLWRANITTVGPQELQAWEAQIERMPTEIRSGPYLVLAKGWLQQDARRLGPSDDIYRRAAWAYLKPPVLYPERPAHQLLGLSGAAEPLAKLTWNDEAARVLEEVVDRFPDSDAARAAKARLEQLPKK